MIVLQTKTAQSWCTYFRFSFLSDNVIVFPNENASIELCNIHTPVDQERPEIPTALILGLPKLKEETDFSEFFCDVEQPAPSCVYGNSYHNGTSTSDPPSFHSPPAEGLVVFTFCLEYKLEDGVTDISDVRFVTHKRALLELLAFSSPAPTTSSGVTGSDPRLLPWSEWGPSRTRWFDLRAGAAGFSQLTWGQRVVVIRPIIDARENCCPISVYNFNPAAILAAASTADSNAVTSLDLLRLFEHDTASLQAFEEPVWSQLPYIKSESPFLFEDIRGAVMDGDRIVMFRVGFCCILLASCL